MILRYILLFGGIVVMITGCNGLVSQNFGTHRLRTVDVETAVSEGLGDADFVELTGAVVGAPTITGPALRSLDNDYLLRPVFTPDQQRDWASGRTVTANLVAWYESERLDGVDLPRCNAPDYCGLRGLVSEPTDKKNPVKQWTTQRIALAPDVTYLQLGEQPMAWYWNLLLFLGGGLLALVPEARRFNRKADQRHAEDGTESA